MADSLYKAQFALRICEEHDKKELHAYCKTCEKKICSSCIKEDHISHEWETITDILREKKRTLPEECKEIHTKQLPDLKKELRRFDRKIEEEDSRFNQNKTILNTSRQGYINEIKRIFDDRIDECQQKSESTIQRYKETRDALKQKVEYLELMTTSLDKDINTLPDHDILDMEKEMRVELEKALSYSADKYTCTALFVPGQIDIPALENMIGEIHSMSVEEMHDINSDFDKITTMEAAADTNAWVKVSNDSNSKLICRTGEILKTLKTTCSDLTVSRSGELVLCGKKKRNVSVLSKDEETITTIDTKPLQPTYISKTENEDILVTLKDDGDHFNLLPTSRRIVQRMSLTGKVLHTYEFREDGKTRLFTWPTRTAENKNTDICVVNWIRDKIGEMVVLRKDGRVMLTYKGNGQENEKFLPVDVECDNKCHILLTEQYSRAIHILSAEGIYLCKLYQYKQLHPYVISIHDDNLWCGLKEGRIKVMKYLNC